MTVRPTITPNDWYYFVGDSSPGAQVWSTASNAYIAMASAAYDTWLTSGVNTVLGISSYGQFYFSQGTADNGAGKVRITLGSTANLTTGQKFNFDGFSGTPLLNGNQTITVVDATHVDVTAVAFVDVDLALVGSMSGAAFMDTQANLFQSLGLTATQSYYSSNYASYTSAVDVALDNPPPGLVEVNMTLPGHLVKLPVMNNPHSIGRGITFTIRNNGSTNSFTVTYQDGTSIITLPPGRMATFMLRDNTTQNGTVTLVPGTGSLFYSYLQTALALSVLGRNTNTDGTLADISTTNGSNAVLMENGGFIVWGGIASANLLAHSVTYGKIQQASALSVLGRSANSIGDLNDIATTAGSNLVLKESGSAITWGTITTANIAADAVDNTKLANMATQTFKGRATAGTGDPEDLDVATAQSMLGIGALTNTITTGTTNLDSTYNGHTVFLDASGGNITITFSSNASLPSYWLVKLVRIDNTANTVTIDPNASETIDGRTTARLISQYDEATVIKQGSNFVTQDARWRKRVVLITSTGANTFTVANEVPLGCTSYTVEAWGAGGSGAGSDLTTGQRYAGGGSGAYGMVVVPTALDTSLTITIGTGAAAVAAAAGGTVGNTGGNTTVVGSNLGTCTAPGGTGGITTQGGSGGVPSGNWTRSLNGGDGPANTGSLTIVGWGGDAPAGGGAGGKNNVGTPGKTPGGGGAGSNHVASNSGAGANGGAVVTI